MRSTWLAGSLFHLAAFRRNQPVVFAFAVGAGLVLLVAALLYLFQWKSAREMRRELRELQARSVIVAVPAAAQEPTDAVVLPIFDGGALVDALHLVANNTSLPLDEINYDLEDATAKPYLRYRVTLSVTSNYPQVRHFVDELGMSLSNVIVDSISCTREDIKQTALSCDLSFSLFYRKGEHG